VQRSAQLRNIWKGVRGKEQMFKLGSQNKHCNKSIHTCSHLGILDTPKRLRTATGCRKGRKQGCRFSNFCEETMLSWGVNTVDTWEQRREVISSWIKDPFSLNFVILKWVIVKCTNVYNTKNPNQTTRGKERISPMNSTRPRKSAVVSHTLTTWSLLQVMEAHPRWSDHFTDIYHTVSVVFLQVALSSVPSDSQVWALPTRTPHPRKGHGSFQPQHFQIVTWTHLWPDTKVYWALAVCTVLGLIQLEMTHLVHCSVFFHQEPCVYGAKRLR
jgi:hypothetical protein